MLTRKPWKENMRTRLKSKNEADANTLGRKYKKCTADSDHSRYFENRGYWAGTQVLKKRMRDTMHAAKQGRVQLALNPISDEHESGPHMEYAHDNSQVRCDAAVSIEGKNLNFKEAPDDDKFG